MIDELLIKLIGGKLSDKERADLHFANFVEVSKLCGDLERENEQLREKLVDAHKSDLYEKMIDRSYSDRKDEEIERLRELVRFQDNQLRQIRNAIYDEGINPAYHQYVMNKQRKEWPTLWEALDEAMKDLAQKPSRYR